jgi:hypothetical protein
MADSPPPETLAWLRHAAAVDGAAYSQVLLHLLDRVGALEQRPIPGFVELAAPTPEAAPVATDGPNDEAWREFIEQIHHAQHVAIREGECPRFDLVEMAQALWREALEQQIPPTPEAAPVATDEELFSAYDAPYGFAPALRAVYDLGRQHGAAQPPAAQPAPPAAPSGGLVDEICRQLPLRPVEIRAVIRLVAAWLDSNACLPDDATPREADGWEMAAQILNREADR